MASINLIPGILTIQAKPLNIFSQKKLIKIMRVTAQETDLRFREIGIHRLKHLFNPPDS